MNLHPDEPIFILRAQDKFAVPKIREWADEIIKDSEATEPQFKKALVAHKIADRMELWQALNPDKVKLPD